MNTNECGLHNIIQSYVLHSHKTIVSNSSSDSLQIYNFMKDNINKFNNKYKRSLY